MSIHPLNRRALVLGMGGSSLAACATTPGATPAASTPPSPARPAFVRPPFAPLQMRTDRITRITVCTRPFRATGPRIEVETVGDKRVVHNYGHGGSGWSLSWGSAAVAAGMALEGGVRPIAVIGCGAIGLTTALTLKRAGAPVIIYASERLPHTRSARASGMWTPDSRIADADRVDPSFAALWERMARIAWTEHQTFVGQPGEPVAFIDRYAVRDSVGPYPSQPRGPEDVRFAEYAGALGNLVPRGHALTPEESPFVGATVRMGSWMQFNIAELGRRLMSDFLLEGGRIEQRTFHAPSELAQLPEPVVVNCTGYGARALFADDSLIPVRGQIAWLPPQPEVRYSLYYKGVSVIVRPDGVGVQGGSGEMDGWRDDTEVADPGEAEKSVDRIAQLYRRSGYNP